LGRKLIAGGHTIIQVWGRDATAASDLAYILDTESTTYWSVVNRAADLYIIAVSDIAIPEVVKELGLPDGTIVHTAGSVPKNILQPGAKHYGVFYPLQSLKKEAINLPDIPFLIDASDTETEDKLYTLGASITDTVVEADDSDRLKLHLAAVFCNNFVNHIYTLTQDYCTKEGLDFRLLIPLIDETAQRLAEMSPDEAQTGPACRNDIATLEKHRALLSAHPRLADFYNLFTKSIQTPL
jgi:predicted short-subunit dehydrogenase-like oxidoreductase (DUF2520 family)